MLLLRRPALIVWILCGSTIVFSGTGRREQKPSRRPVGPRIKERQPPNVAFTLRSVLGRETASKYDLGYATSGFLRLFVLPDSDDCPAGGR